MSKVINMTSGSPSKLILTFAFPAIITNIGQQLYLNVDTAIVGRGVGVSALAAVGCTGWIYGLILWFIMALTTAFSTFVSRYFGMNDKNAVNRCLALSSVLSLIIGVILTVLGIVTARPLLEIMNTPSDIIKDAENYLYIMVSGTVILMGYNLTSAILRAFGDSRSPLVAMIISAILNIVLDLIFVMVFKWGVSGAAIASVISQLVSFLYSFIVILKIDFVEIKKEHFNPDFALIKSMLFFSLPIGFQNAILSVGGMVLQATVNLEGSIFIAGYTATNRLYGMFECTAIALGSAITTFMSQNFGANKPERLRRGFKTSFVIVVVFSIVVALFMLLSGKFLLSIFIDPEEAGALTSLAIAYKYLFIMLLSLPILYLIYLYRSTLQAIGNAFWSMLSGVAEFVVRVLFATIIYDTFSTECIYYVESSAWIGALLVLIIPAHYYLKRIETLYSNSLN